MYLIDRIAPLLVRRPTRYRGGTVSYFKVAAVDQSLRRAAGVVVEAWCGVSAAAKLLRGQRREWVPGNRGSELRLGSLLQPAVMLVHGLAADKSCFSALERHLHSAGYTVYSVTYSCLGSDIDACARNLEREAAWLLEETGSERVYVVAHSLGGVVLRWAATHTRLREWLTVGITLGSPHRGTPTAHLAPSGLPGYGRIVSQLRPGVTTLEDVELQASPDVRWVAIAGGNDLVVPPRYARLPGYGNVRNAVVPWCGHMALTRSSECFAIILEELRAAGEKMPRAIHDASSHPHRPSLIA
jgi:pimeloyl-ACP methyl ester carboxylesterase